MGRSKGKRQLLKKAEILIELVVQWAKLMKIGIVNPKWKKRGQIYFFYFSKLNINEYEIRRD